MNTNSAIRFYSTRDAFGEFSNFAAAPILLDGRRWPTVEHWFQAQKFLDLEHQEAIRAVQSPMVAARMGRSRARPLRPDWESVKDGVMEQGVRAKFTQHPHLRELLLSTGERPLVEHTRNDRYWGDGGDGTGRNRLGEILMRIRAELTS